MSIAGVGLTVGANGGRTMPLTDAQRERIRRHFLEERPRTARHGRSPVPAKKVLEAVLWILTTVAQWHTPPQRYPNHKAVHRRFQRWCRAGLIDAVLGDGASELRDLGAIKLTDGFIDATFVRAKGREPDIRKTTVGKGMTIMVVADSGGMPLALGVVPANRAECRLVRLTLDRSFCGKPPNLIGDKAYDDDPPDAELRERGVEMIAPHRGNRTRVKTQDGWRRRRPLVRREYRVKNFLGLVRLAVLCLFRRHC